MGQNKKNALGLDWDVLSKVISMLAAGLFAGVFWLFVRIPEPCVMFVLGAAFSAMIAYNDTRWPEKLKTVSLMMFFSGIMQFGITMLIQEKYLLLIWVFIFSIFLLRYWSNKAASTITIAIGGLGIATDAGFQPGADRFINLMIAGACSIAALAIVEYVTVPMRIQIVLRQYLTVLIMQMESIMSGEGPDKRYLLKMKALNFANKANALIAGERFYRLRYIAMALRGQHVLERLHRISRAMIVLENASSNDLENNQAVASELLTEMRNVAEQINKGETIKNKTADMVISADSNMAADSLRIIARELSVINGHCL